MPQTGKSDMSESGGDQDRPIPPGNADALPDGKPIRAFAAFCHGAHDHLAGDEEPPGAGKLAFQVLLVGAADCTDARPAEGGRLRSGRGGGDVPELQRRAWRDRDYGFGLSGAFHSGCQTSPSYP